MNYYIKGDAANADKIRAAFESKGYDISWPEGCANPDVINIGVERNGAKYIVAESSEYIKDIIKTHPDYKELELPVEPKFKVGDKVIHNGKERTITFMDDTFYDFDGGCAGCRIEKQDELLSPAPKPHYDISNFQPFDKVLGRNTCRSGVWRADLFSYIHKNGKLFVGIGYTWEQCIPFEGNEHLLGTTDMCDEQYINW